MFGRQGGRVALATRGDAPTFTIEPMLTLGSPEVAMWDDGRTAVTLDGRRTAQFEHTLVCTADGAEILTRSAAGECAQELFTEPVG